MQSRRHATNNGSKGHIEKESETETERERVCAVRPS